MENEDWSSELVSVNPEPQLDNLVRTLNERLHQVVDVELCQYTDSLKGAPSPGTPGVSEQPAKLGKFEERSQMSSSMAKKAYMENSDKEFFALAHRRYISNYFNGEVDTLRDVLQQMNGAYAMLTDIQKITHKYDGGMSDGAVHLASSNFPNFTGCSEDSGGSSSSFLATAFQQRLQCAGHEPMEGCVLPAVQEPVYEDLAQESISIQQPLPAKLLEIEQLTASILRFEVNKRLFNHISVVES